MAGFAWPCRAWGPGLLAQNDLMFPMLLSPHSRGDYLRPNCLLADPATAGL